MLDELFQSLTQVSYANSSIVQNFLSRKFCDEGVVVNEGQLQQFFTSNCRTLLHGLVNDGLIQILTLVKEEFMASKEEQELGDVSRNSEVLLVYLAIEQQMKQVAIALKDTFSTHAKNYQTSTYLLHFTEMFVGYGVVLALIYLVETRWARWERVAWGVVHFFREDMLERNKYFITLLNKHKRQTH